jgi:prolyl-tRNA synthetase
MALSPEGEDEIALCDHCGYVVNTEIAETLSPPINDKKWEYEEVHTGEKKTVEEVAKVLDINPAYLIKTLLLIGNEAPFLVLLRGDQQLHEKKLKRIAGDFRPAHKEEVKEILKVEAGNIGPMDCHLTIYADTALKQGTYIAGANKKEYHVRGIKAGIHFDPIWHNLHAAQSDDFCSKCNSPVCVHKAIEIANTFRLGTKYSLPLKAFYLDSAGTERPIIMGSYGIGPARVAAAVVEQSHDDKGLIWPESISPFDVAVLPLNLKDDKIIDITEGIYKDLRLAGFDVLLDNREVRAGIKFNDADLIGIPWQIIIGPKSVKEGLVEIKSRRTGITEQVTNKDIVKNFKEIREQAKH